MAACLWNCPVGVSSMASGLVKASLPQQIGVAASGTNGYDLERST